jgi:hypothetical protein
MSDTIKIEEESSCDRRNSCIMCARSSVVFLGASSRGPCRCGVRLGQEYQQWYAQTADHVRL